jgi:hypothetical protein
VYPSGRRVRSIDENTDSEWVISAIGPGGSGSRSGTDGLTLTGVDEPHAPSADHRHVVRSRSRLLDTVHWANTTAPESPRSEVIRRAGASAFRYAEEHGSTGPDVQAEEQVGRTPTYASDAPGAPARPPGPRASVVSRRTVDLIAGTDDRPERADIIARPGRRAGHRSPFVESPLTVQSMVVKACRTRITGPE